MGVWTDGTAVSARISDRLQTIIEDLFRAVDMVDVSEDDSVCIDLIRGVAFAMIEAVARVELLSRFSVKCLIDSSPELKADVIKLIEDVTELDWRDIPRSRREDALLRFVFADVPISIPDISRPENREDWRKALGLDD